MFKVLVIALCLAGLYGVFAILGILQGKAFEAYHGYGPSWAALVCAIFGLVVWLKGTK